MPFRKLFEKLFGNDADDMLADMVVSDNDTAKILSSALNYQVKPLEDIVSSRPKFAATWMSLEIARRHIEMVGTFTNLRAHLRTQIRAMKDDRNFACAEEMQRAVDIINRVLEPKCKHEWKIVDHPMGAEHPKGEVCGRCGTMHVYDPDNPS